MKVSPDIASLSEVLTSNLKKRIESPARGPGILASVVKKNLKKRIERLENIAERVARLEALLNLKKRIESKGLDKQIDLGIMRESQKED